MRGNSLGLELKVRSAANTFEELNENYELASTLAAWGECLLLLPSGQRMRVPLDLSPRPPGAPRRCSASSGCCRSRPRPCW